MDGSGGHRLDLPYSRDRMLLVDFSPANYNRQPHADATLEATIDTTWHAVTSANPCLFNGTKFRLHGLVASPSTSHCTLQLGLTDYKTFQATHAAPHPRTRFGLRSMARPLGNVVIVETADKCTVLLVRNAAVGEGKGKAVFPGGHPEPSALQPPPTEGDGTRVLAELWIGARREVLEELFLADEQVQSVADMRFLGIVSRNSDSKASMVFYARITPSAEELLHLYRTKNVHQEETVKMIVKPLEFLKELTGGELLEGQFVLMPETVGAAELWVQNLNPQFGSACNADD